MALDPKSIPYVVNRFGSTTLLDDISESSSTIQVVDASSLPPGDDGGCIQIETEIILFERREGNTLLNCRRGQDGSTATSHTRGNIVTSKIVALNFNNIKAALLDLQSQIKGAKQKEIITLTQEMIDEEYFDLEHAPVNIESIELTPVGGPMQVIDIDYEVVGNRLSWANLGLSGVLEVDEKIIVLYDI